MADQVSSADICGIQFNRIDCDTGEVMTDPSTDVALTCAAQSYERSAVLTDGVTDRQQGGRAGKFCATRVTDGVVDYWDYSFTLCSAYDIRAMSLLGITEPIFGADGTTIEGYKDLLHQEADDLCCTPGGGPCISDEVAMLAWSLAWCDEDQHPEFLYDVHVVPRLKFRIDTNSIVRTSTFQTMTLRARTRIPKPNPNFDALAAVGDPNALRSGYGLGPGDIYPQNVNETGGLDRHFANVFTNTPFPNGCSCGQCV